MAMRKDWREPAMSSGTWSKGLPLAPRTGPPAAALTATWESPSLLPRHKLQKELWDKNEAALLLFHLNTRLLIAMQIHSGGKMIHRLDCLRETVLPVVLLPLLDEDPWIPGPTGFTAPRRDGGWLLSPPISPLRTSEPLDPDKCNSITRGSVTKSSGTCTWATVNASFTTVCEGAAWHGSRAQRITAVAVRHWSVASWVIWYVRSSGARVGSASCPRGRKGKRSKCVFISFGVVSQPKRGNSFNFKNSMELIEWKLKRHENYQDRGLRKRSNTARKTCTCWLCAGYSLLAKVERLAFWRLFALQGLERACEANRPRPIRWTRSGSQSSATSDLWLPSPSPVAPWLERWSTCPNERWVGPLLLVLRKHLNN